MGGAKRNYVRTPSHSRAMRVLFLVCIFFPCLEWATADSSTTTDLLWPLPRSSKFGNTVYSLNPETFTFVGTGPGGTSDSLKNAFERYTNLIFQTPAPFFPSGGSSGAAQQELTSLEVNVMSDNESLGLNTNETCKFYRDKPHNVQSRILEFQFLHAHRLPHIYMV